MPNVSDNARADHAGLNLDRFSHANRLIPHS
jgi:hypothetical protein